MIRKASALGPKGLPRSLRRIRRWSYGDVHTGNVLLHGDNAVVLDQIVGSLRGAVRCVYIDPPYNNQERYNHYDDRLPHAEWIDQLGLRLALLREVLTADGSIWISIDDREVHYLKVAADRVFGRENFITTIVWEHRTTRENRKVFSNNHEYILVYARDLRGFASSRNSLPPTEALQRRYKNPDDDPRGPWQSVSATAQGGHATKSQYYTLIAPGGRRHQPPKGRCWLYNRERMQDEIRRKNVWFGRDGKGAPRIKRFLNGTKLGLTPETLWQASEVGTNDSAKKHLLELLPEKAVFDTPKPERLIAKIIHIATDPHDIVLDAYLGSGTTAAVAHKMGRTFVGIEAGRHAVTHCASRLKAVVEGEQGGVSKGVGWSGGGGFDFYRVVKKLLKRHGAR